MWPPLPPQARESWRGHRVWKGHSLGLSHYRHQERTAAAGLLCTFPRSGGDICPFFCFNLHLHQKHHFPTARLHCPTELPRGPPTAPPRTAAGPYDPGKRPSGCGGLSNIPLPATERLPPHQESQRCPRHDLSKADGSESPSGRDAGQEQLFSHRARD